MKLASVKQQVIGRRLVWNILFYGGHIGVFIFGWVAQMRNEKLAILNLLKFSVWISRGAGLCLAIDGALLLLPGARHLSSARRHGADRARQSAATLSATSGQSSPA